MRYDTDDIDKQLYCPGYDSEVVHERVNAMWDKVGVVPLPDFSRPCQQCGNQQRIRHVSYGVRDTGGVSYRTDVLCQCYHCFAKQTYGVPIEDDRARRAQDVFDMHITERSPSLVYRPALLGYLDGRDYDFSHFVDTQCHNRQWKVGRAMQSWGEVKGVPVPKYDIECHQCGEGEREIRMSYISVGVADEAGIPRCDTSFSCKNCFAVFSFNVPISDGQLDRLRKTFGIEGEITRDNPRLIGKAKLRQKLA